MRPVCISAKDVKRGISSVGGTAGASIESPGVVPQCYPLKLMTLRKAPGSRVRASSSCDPYAIRGHLNSRAGCCGGDLVE